MGYSLYITEDINQQRGAVIFESFLTGIYTLLLVYTIRMLFRRNGKGIYTITLCLLWFLVVLTLFLDWRRVYTSVTLSADPIGGENGFSPMEHDLSLELNDALSSAVNIVADALVIYRCYSLLAGQKWVCLLLGGMLLSNILLLILTLVHHWVQGPSSFVPEPVYLVPRDVFVLAFMSISVGITSSSTFLIIRRILSTIRTSPDTPNLAPYRKIQRMVLESGAIYSIAMFATIIVVAINRATYMSGSSSLDPVVRAKAVVATNVLEVLAPISGIAPTLIALKVGCEAQRAGAIDSDGLSELLFRRTRSRFGGITSFFTTMRSGESWRGSPDVEGTAQIGGNDPYVTTQNVLKSVGSAA